MRKGTVVKPKDVSSIKGEADQDDQFDVSEPVELKMVEWREIIVPISGTGPGLLTSHIPDWVIENIAYKQAGLPIPNQKKRTLEEQYQDSLYMLEPARDGSSYGFPAAAFKKAIIRAVMSGMIDPALKGTVVRTWFTTPGGEDGYVALQGTPEQSIMPARNKDVVVAAIRAHFREWSTMVRFRYDPRAVSPNMLMHMLNQAGEGVGIGAYRPEKDGNYGCFVVDSVKK